MQRVETSSFLNLCLVLLLSSTSFCISFRYLSLAEKKKKKKFSLTFHSINQLHQLDIHHRLIASLQLSLKSKSVLVLFL